jgi:hypothetical protein
MKVLFIETAVVLTMVFIVFKGIYFVFASKVQATERNQAFYFGAGFSALPFAIALWHVLPQLSTALAFFEKSEDWGEPIQYAGGCLLLIIITGFISLILSFTVFRIVTKEQSIWALIAANNQNVTLLLGSMIITSAIALGVLAGEMARWMVPFGNVPYHF